MAWNAKFDAGVYHSETESYRQHWTSQASDSGWPGNPGQVPNVWNRQYDPGSKAEREEQRKAGAEQRKIVRRINQLNEHPQQRKIIFKENLKTTEAEQRREGHEKSSLKAAADSPDQQRKEENESQETRRAEPPSYPALPPAPANEVPPGLPHVKATMVSYQQYLTQLNTAAAKKGFNVHDDVSKRHFWQL